MPMKCAAVAALVLPTAAMAFTAMPSQRPASACPAFRATTPTPLRSAASPVASSGLDPNGQAVANAPLDPKDSWVATMDLEKFGAEIKALGKKMEAQQGEADVKHIKKICLWSNICMAVGLGTMWMAPNPITAFALSTWTLSRWTTIAHHTNHGGYNKADSTRFFNSKGFALGGGIKRVQQWFDWMLPEAWNVEHNNLHHYRLSEIDDPDLVERNLGIIRDTNVPMPFKYVAVAFLACTWKWFYYAPNTYKELKVQQMRRQGVEITEQMQVEQAFTLKAFFDGHAKGTKLYTGWDLFRNVMGPYLIGHFVLLPLPALLIGVGAFQNAVINLILGDIITNIHAFIVIATNHAGEDLYTFDRGCAPNSATFYMRQAASSANFRTGGDVNDFMHGWLNYQVEHHMWPQLTALSYQKAQPEVKAICERNGIPYIQESVWIRLRKTVDIMVGKANQRPYPAEYEVEKDFMVWNSNKAESAAARAVVEAPNANVLGADGKIFEKTPAMA